MLKTAADRNYRSLCNRIGAALLMFYLIFNSLSVGITTAQELIAMVFPSDLIDTVMSLGYYASYLFAFMFPVLFFKLISRKHPFPDMKLEFKLNKNLWLVIPAALGINFLMAEINYLILTPINFEDIISPAIPNTYYAHNFVLDTLGTGIVPAFCEEFLFRGLILSALLPYGKKTAIFGSAVLFALMHQNPGQLIYTFVLGIILGYMVTESGSIWGGILLHFVNNFVSVVMSAAVYVLPEKIGEIVYYVIFSGIMGVGLTISVVLIIFHSVRRVKNKESEMRDIKMPRRVSAYELGLFESNELPEARNEGIDYKLSRGYAAKGFFAPFNLVFIILAVINMMSLIAMAILNNLGVFDGIL